MLKTIVLVCNFMNPTNCIEMVDEKNLYRTFNQCAARAYELQQAIVRNAPTWRALHFKCVRGTNT